MSDDGLDDLEQFDWTRLADQEWYRNLRATSFPDRSISVTWCDHMAAVTINLISVCQGDTSNGPCCPLNGQHSDMPRSWRFSL